MKDIGLDTIPYLKSFLYQIKSESLEDSKKEKQRRKKNIFKRHLIVLIVFLEYLLNFDKYVTWVNREIDSLTLFICSIELPPVQVVQLLN